MNITDNFIRRAKIKDNFYNKNSSNANFIDTFYVPNTNYEPVWSQAHQNFSDTTRHNMKALTDHIKSSPPDRKALDIINGLTSNPNQMIIPSDKNLGLVIISTDHYDNLVRQHLDDTTNYRITDVKDIIDSAQTTLHSLNLDTIRQLQSDIKSIGKFLTLASTETTIPRFKILPKLHKSPVKGRPIAGAYQWITTRMSKVVSFVLRPIVEQVPSILRNSQDLMSRTEHLAVSDTDILVTMDIASLYPNMMNAATKIIPKCLIHITDLPTERVIWLEKAIAFILDHSAVSYNETVYQQIDGIPMGTNCAVELANLYVLLFVELELWKRQSFKHVRCWYRYIDDVFMIWKGTKEELLLFIQEVNQICPKISFTHEMSFKEIPFLDLMVKKVDNKIAFQCYQKPMNRYMYLPFRSMHPMNTKKGFIKGELIRYARNSTHREDFLKMKILFRQRLTRRGYPHQFISNIFDQVTHQNRFQTKSNDSNDVVPFIIKFHSSLEPIKITSELIKSWHYLNNGTHFRPIVAYSKYDNVLELLQKKQKQIERSRLKG
jgi:hypothetical protein